MSLSPIRRWEGPSRAATAVLLLVAAALSAPRPVHAAKGPVILDERWVCPGFDQRNPRRVAILPAVTQEGFDSSHLMSDLFFNGFMNDGRDWLPPGSAHLRLGASAHERDSTFREIVKQVRREGHTNAATTADLARRLRVDALVFLRVDRWEHAAVNEEMTSIEVRAELVDSTGATLLRLVARSRVFGERRPSEIEMPRASASRVSVALPSTPVSAPTGSSASVGGATAATAAPPGTSGGGGSTGSATSHPQGMPKMEHTGLLTQEDVARLGGSHAPEAAPEFEAAAKELIKAWGPLLPPPPGPARSPASGASSGVPAH